MLKKFFALLLVAGLATSAQAALVTATLNIDAGGTYNVTLTDSLGDNFGIASYQVTLGNVATVVHTAPRSAAATNVAEDEGPAGFTLFRSPTSQNLAPGNPITVTGSQDTVAPTPFLIRGFGQTAGSFAANGIITGGATTQPAWGAPLQIITGTWVANAVPTLNAAAFNLFSAATGTDAPGLPPADVRLVTIGPGPQIPEPSTIVLAGLALVGLIGYSRRNK